ncbi:hypothetical protein EYB53_005085 [Candidatus Chloroploca sp. M-50]|uniref:Uncharacterized protein n=1 Tax=Candidatus Chloroploca mongolica TaxID=2528176 RepID=A0ABS4D6L5_9CHLR|nr:hypothetical protein [Candidatus Chloroploca mongolica]MBP1465076.1 hypothetical protein [Candidatus Chloroploca mongolica]
MSVEFSMKPRRWYSSPESQTSGPRYSVEPFPPSIYWHFTTMTARQQGGIIKREQIIVVEPAAPLTRAEQATRWLVSLSALSLRSRIRVG